MKKIFFYLLFLISSSFIFAVSDDIQKIRDSKKLVVAMAKDDFFPFFMQVGKEAKLIGCDVELAKAIASELGVEAVFKRDYETYDAIIEAVFNNEADVGISFLTKTLQRAKKVYFTTPYVRSYLAFLINRKLLAKVKKQKDEPIIKSLDLKENKIGALKGSSYTYFANKIFKNAKVIEYDEVYEEIRAVKNEEIVACLISEVELNEFIVLNPDSSLDLQTVLIEDYIEEISIALAPNYPHLKYWLDEYIQAKEKKYILDFFHEYQDVIKESAKKQKIL